MHRTLAFLTILGAVPILLRLVLNGVISLEHAGITMGVLLIALAMGTSFLRIALPVFAVAIFVTEYSAGDPSQLGGLFTVLMALVMALYGIYLMLRGIFRP